MNVINVSGGISSIMAAHYHLQDNKAKIVYIDTKAHHPDMASYINYVEEDILKHEIIRLSSAYEDHFDVIQRTGHSKQCRIQLKIRVRQEFESKNPNIRNYVWGFDEDEKKRYKSLIKNNLDYSHIAPLIDLKMKKEQVHENYFKFFPRAKYPTMYRMGYNNNNCIGCPEGGIGYWKAIKIDFPEVFEKALAVERSLLRKKEDWLEKGEHFTFCKTRKKIDGVPTTVYIPLSEIDNYKGRPNRHILSNCGIACYGIEEDEVTKC